MQCMLFLIYQTKQSIRNNFNIINPNITNTPYLVFSILNYTPNQMTPKGITIV